MQDRIQLFTEGPTRRCGFTPTPSVWAALSDPLPRGQSVGEGRELDSGQAGQHHRSQVTQAPRSKSCGSCAPRI